MKKNIFVMLTVMFVMIGTLVLGATFSDVKGTKYQSSVELLTELKIVNGKSATSFAPNDVVKRAEMAKMLVIALGKDSEATKAKGKTKFPDVKSDYWATGYINVASELGLIKGYPDGTFAPEDTVSYVESVAMLLRALNYEDVNKLSWPDGYMKRAKDISLIDNVTINNNNEGAIRGNISILICNTLKSNVREITGSNANGMIYGNGETLINKYFSNYNYISNGEITDIDVANKKITVTDSKNKKHTFKYTSKDIYELYGKDVTLLYDKKNDTFKSFDIASSNKTIHGNVTKVENKKLYIKKAEYAVPSKSKIKLFGVSSINDADEVYITTKNGTVTHMVGIGEEEIYYGIAAAKSYKSGSDYKVALYDFDEERTTYILADNTTIAKGDVVIYTLNDDDELVVKYHVSEDDGYTVQTISKTSIKLNKKGTYDIATSDAIITVADGTIEKKKYATSISKGDTACVLDLNDSKVIIGFVDENSGDDDDYDEDDDNTSATKAIARKRLNAAISFAIAKKKKETSYSVATFEKMLAKLEAAEDINQSSASISVMDRASYALETAINNLAKATSSDRTLRAELANLDAKIKEAKAIKKEEYTTDSYAKMTTALKSAEAFNRSTATVAKIQTQVNNLQKALDGLKSIATTKEIEEVKKGMNELIAEAEKVSKASCTDESYADLQEALTAAKNANYDTMTIQKLTSLNNNLYTALKNLVSKDKAAFDAAVKAYEKLEKEFLALDRNDYTSDSYNDAEKALIEIDDYKEDEKAEKFDYDYVTNTKKINEAIKALEEAKNALVKTKECRAKEDLAETVKYAKQKKEAEWNAEEAGITFAEFKTMISGAESLLKSSTATESEIKEADANLGKYIY